MEEGQFRCRGKKCFEGQTATVVWCTSGLGLRPALPTTATITDLAVNRPPLPQTTKSGVHSTPKLQFFPLIRSDRGRKNTQSS